MIQTKRGSPRQILKFAFVFVLITNFAFGQNSEADISHEGTNRINIDSLTLELEEIYSRGHINGIGVALVDENGTLYEKGFGFANKELKKAYTNHSIQNIASISKTFLGLALLKAQIPC